MIDDFDLIVSSFQAQYGLRLSRELETMKWNEFRDLLIGIGPETPLGRMVAIRAENDKEVLKYFTPEQHRIRNEWNNRHSQYIKNMSPEKVEDMLNALKNAFVTMAVKEG